MNVVSYSFLLVFKVSEMDCVKSRVEDWRLLHLIENTEAERDAYPD